MLRVKVVVRKKVDHAIEVAIEMTIRTADTLRFESRLDSTSVSLIQPDGNPHPTQMTAECAIYSGASYAIGMMNDWGYEIVAMRAGGVCDLSDGDAFANAAAIGVAFSLGRGNVIPDSALGEWELVGLIADGDPSEP